MAAENEQNKRWAKVVAKAWADEDYKQRLIDNPGSVLAEEGMEVPAGVELKVVEASENQSWLVLPPKPSDGNFEEGTERLAAGSWFCLCTSGGCIFG